MKRFPVILIAVLACLITLDITTACTKLFSENSSNNTPPIVDSTALGMIIYYPLNNGVGDQSENGRNGTAFNLTATTDRKGKANSAYLFDGSTSYISIPDSPPLRLNNNNFTISIWVKVMGYDAGKSSYIISKKTSAANDGWGTALSGNAAPGNIGINGIAYFTPGESNPIAGCTQKLALGTWYMLTVTYDSKSSDMKFYVNGILNFITGSIVTPNATTNAVMYIGRDNPATTGSGSFFNGALDDIRIYNRALSAEQIRLLYISTF
jgi:hypothetical protein